MICIIDYGMGNLRSVQKALQKLNFEAYITSDAAEIRKAKGVILPGVGAFRDAISTLRRSGLTDAIFDTVQKGVPFLGICLGMQLLLTVSEENGTHEGLNLIPGRVVRFDDELIVPHMGWNQVEIKKNHPLVKGVKTGEFVYFVHSYYVVPEKEDVILGTTRYGVLFPSIIARENLMGIQFHPEKSSSVGLKILKNYGEMVVNASVTGC